VWQARTQPRETIDIVVEGRPQRVLVHRADTRVVVAVIDRLEAEVLGRLLAGETLGSTMGALADDGGTPGAVTGWLADWVARGLIARCARAGG
jgi:hypothetical protein